MSTKPPFSFDLRVSADKKRKQATRRGATAPEPTGRRCDNPGCDRPASYRAPTSPDLLDEFFWFCKDHIRDYNLKWNFFQGSSEDDFQKFIDKDRVWGRETKPFSRQGDGNAWARMGVDDPMAILGEKATMNPGAVNPTGGATRKLPPTERKALEILDARDTMTKTEIRKSYKVLIKVLHPDMNGGDRSLEEQLQEVVWAWDQLKDSRFFRD
ncbi:MAG: J domain-containing protein [Paracoccaceae bacterium]